VARSNAARIRTRALPHWSEINGLSVELNRKRGESDRGAIVGKVDGHRCGHRVD
jgi:hypothetical protein